MPRQVRRHAVEHVGYRFPLVVDGLERVRGADLLAE
jgi:hypothetical protein